MRKRNRGGGFDQSTLYALCTYVNITVKLLCIINITNKKNCQAGPGGSPIIPINVPFVLFC
jgi:hypothetical protein